MNLPHRFFPRRSLALLAVLITSTLAAHWLAESSSAQQNKAANKQPPPAIMAMPSQSKDKQPPPDKKLNQPKDKQPPFDKKLNQPKDKQPAKGKRPLTHNDYDLWNTIQSPAISPDGKFAAYTIVSAKGDHQLVVRNVNSVKEYRHTRGWTAPPTAKGDQTNEAQGGGGAGKMAFTADSKRVVFTIAASKGDPKKDVKETKASIGIMDLANGEVKIIEGVRTFVLPENSGDGVVYHKLSGASAGEKKAEEFDDEDDDFDGVDFFQGKGKQAGPKQAPANRAPADLVMRDFASGGENTIANVIDFTMTRDGTALVCSFEGKANDDSGVFAFVAEASKLVKLPLATGKAKYSRLAWDEKQNRFAFLADHGATPKESGPVSLYLWDREGKIGSVKDSSGQAVELLNSKTTTGLKDGCVLTERGGLSFSLDGARIFLGVAPPAPVSAMEPGKGGKDDKAVVELWHWKDEYIQPMQKARLQQEKNRTYAAVYNIKTKRLVQLADKKMPTVMIAPDGNSAIGTDDTPYRALVAYDGNYSDIYLVNTNDGSRKALLKKHHWGLSFSASGKYAAFFDGKDWNTVSLPGGSVKNVTKALQEKGKIRFSNEEHDSPSGAPAYGLLGFSSDDSYIVIYDKYDIWEVDAKGNGFRNLTGIGRPNRVQFRYAKLDPKEKGVDLRKPMLLRFENLNNRATGFVALDPRTNNPPVELLAEHGSFGLPTKAKNADMLLFTYQTFYDYPDLYVASTAFKDAGKISDVNPQRKEFMWGKAELVHYLNTDGVPLSGVLIVPEDFDAKKPKQYPMLVYIYERLSQNVHHFVAPKEGTSINPSYYASNDYIVFMPDITYTIGYPGQSALKSVLPGIQRVVDIGIVKEGAIGIQGHSWGGYQVAYMITQTGRFKAAAAGAPVSNMTSAYDGIRWGTGMPRQFQYEKTQSRIGGNLWEFPLRYVENSPVFMADRVKTPLMMLHNDQDDAVPWYQGIEFYLALRRLDKEVYLFNYPGEPHGLKKKANQRDYTIRMQQFFDHHLRGAPSPEWMEKGIPYSPRPTAKETPMGGAKE